MIRKSIKVKINWLRPDEDGRNPLIGCYHYRPTIIFMDSKNERHWSFFLDFYSLPEYDQPTVAEGAFLADFSTNEPWGKMTKGTIFYVMEGTQKIGIGTVLEESRDIDTSNLPSSIYPYETSISAACAYPGTLK
ncbi:MAG: hypothetical protein LBC20_05455 [Planctomycetaceae bacterium]|jgi:hypothetical protein|nr:hypothetical protein [Planctomycetaceae bacterium]